MVSTGTTPRLLFEDRVDCFIYYCYLKIVLTVLSIIVFFCPLFLFTSHILTLNHYILYSSIFV